MLLWAVWGQFSVGESLFQLILVLKAYTQGLFQCTVSINCRVLINKRIFKINIIEG